MRGVALVLVAGCSLGGHAPKYDYFVLTSSHHAQATTSGPPTVEVTDVAIPPYLDRDAIVTRVDANRLEYSKQDRWAEPLDQAFERTLQQELAARLPPKKGAATYELHVDVFRFERQVSEQVELWARWRLRGEGEPVLAGESRIAVPVAGRSDEDVAVALSGAIAKMADEIAERVRAGS